MKRKAVLLRLREVDSQFGVTSATLKNLSTALGLSAPWLPRTSPTGGNAGAGLESTAEMYSEPDGPDNR